MRQVLIVLAAFCLISCEAPKPSACWPDDDLCGSEGMDTLGETWEDHLATQRVPADARPEAV